MLGKLIKHEWKMTYKIGGSLLLFLVVLGLLTGLSFLTPAWRAMVSNNDVGRFTLADMLGVTMIILFCISLVAVSAGLIIYLAVHFFKGMYSEEGYLTHTLPATAHEQLGSRLIVGSIWMLLYGVAVLVSVGIVLGILLQVALHGVGMTAAEFWSRAGEGLREIDREFRQGAGMSLGVFVMVYVLMFVVGSVCSVCYLYGAATLGQLSAKHKVLMSIASYFGIMILNQIITSMVILPISMSGMLGSERTYYSSTEAELVMSPVGYMLGTTLTTLALNVVIAAALYFASIYIIKNKLNLE